PRQNGKTFHKRELRHRKGTVISLTLLDAPFLSRYSFGYFADSKVPTLGENYVSLEVFVRRDSHRPHNHYPDRDPVRRRAGDAASDLQRRQRHAGRQVVLRLSTARFGPADRGWV